jgi:RNA polymerase sigma-70 factor (ECF subfamily)
MFVGDTDRFRGWAATIVHHRAMDTCRARARRPTPARSLNDRDDYDEPVGVADTAAVALDALSTDLALALIAELPRQQAQAVLLRAVVGLDARTAAEVLGKRPGAVRVAAHRGLKKLARQLRYHPEEGRWTLV